MRLNSKEDHTLGSKYDQYVIEGQVASLYRQHVKSPSVIAVGLITTLLCVAFTLWLFFYVATFLEIGVYLFAVGGVVIREMIMYLVKGTCPTCG